MKRLALIGCRGMPVLLVSQLALGASNAELSLNDLLDLKVTVATKKDTSIRETPGIVTVITREQMLDMGARDVVDVLLRVVPGYSLVTEIEGGQLLSIRGINAIEGKFLVMVDGLDINEEKFGIVQFARHFPVNTLDRIEIIRGPGSSIYGGYASLGVINIMTRSANRPGTYVSVDMEQGSRAFMNRTVAAGVARDKGDLTYSANLVASRALLSDQAMTSFYGDPIDLKDGRIEMANMTMNIKYKGAYVKTLFDLYRAPELYFDEPAVVTWNQVKERWDTYQLELGYEWTSGDLKVTPFANVKRQYPYWVDQGGYWYRNRVDRKTGGVTVQYDLNEKTNLIGGYQGFVHAVYRAPNLNEGIGEETFHGDPNIDHISYRNDSFFLQAMNYNDIANLTAGVRYDKTDIHGDFFAPRMGFTKVWQDLHAKYMIAQSFRVPGGIIPNRVEDSNNYGIKPETTLNNEVEVGYRFTEKFWAALNIFDHLIHRPITYKTGESGSGSYANGDDQGTRGVESEWRFQSGKNFATFTYAYYQLTKNAGAEVPGHPKANFGQAQQKAGLFMGYHTTRVFSINPSVSLIGERFTYTQQGELDGGTDDEGNPTRGPQVFETLPLTALVNLTFRHYEFLWKKGLDVSLSIENLGNTRFLVAQPYQAEYPVAPIPFAGRSFMVRTNYEF